MVWAQILNETTRVIELTLAVAGFAEAAKELGQRAAEGAASNVEAVRRLATTIIGQDPFDILARNPDFVRAAAAASASQRTSITDWESAFDALIHAARALVSAVPIETLLSVGHLVGDPELAHRCRMAHGALKAFLRRCDPSVKASTRAAGRAYAQGRITATEVALLLDLTPSDAVALLEEQGFHRPIGVIELTDADRAERLAKIREDRFARRGAPASSSDLIDRDVVASQRIEGVDARQWTFR
ncbi:MAG: hypothetical protein KF878_04685 [Planctomycetes bacterium]|nr:hypothetical protein [Planctomycetota bacterium]